MRFVVNAKPDRLAAATQALADAGATIVGRTADGLVAPPRDEIGLECEARPATAARACERLKHLGVTTTLHGLRDAA